MSDAERDEACVALLLETSPVGVRARIRYEERLGVDAYACEPSDEERDPRAELRVCAADDCWAAFFADALGGGSHRMYCSATCRNRVGWHRRRAA